MYGLVEFVQCNFENVLFFFFYYKNKPTENRKMVEMDLSITKSFQGAVGSSV